MARGKFSGPRSNPEEDRQIEEAFRQVTGQEPSAQPARNLSPQRGAEAPSTGDKAEDSPRSSERDDGLDFSIDPSIFSSPEAEVATPNLEQTQTFPPVWESEDPSVPDQPPYQEDVQPSRWRDLWTRALALYRENRKAALVCLCAVAVVLVVGIVAIVFFASSDPYGGKILGNVYVAGVNVGGMTKKEAISAVEQAVGQSYATQNMVVDLEGVLLELDAAQVQAQLDVKDAVDAAYDYGRTGTKAEQESARRATGDHIIGLLPYLQWNETYIRSELERYAQGSVSTLTQANYGLEGTQPELSADKFDEDAPCQTLVITLGTPEVSFDVDAVYDQILDAYSLHEFYVEATGVETVTLPDPVDLEAIYQEFYIAPVDASVDLQSYQVIPGSYGYGFDLGAAQELLDQADYGEEIRIPMEYIAPELLDDDSFFQDVLGEYRTTHTADSNRTTNLTLACQALDGTILNPGEALSFNATLGQRTTAKGYKALTTGTSTEPAGTIGSGISQVSSTLYCAALLADLDIVSRSSHRLPVSYVDYGLDAAVSWDAPDFQFRNSTSYPIQIEAQVSGGYVTVRILGTEQRDYYIQLESTVTSTYEPDTEYSYFTLGDSEGYEDGDVIQEGEKGYYVKTYKLKYDAETNTLLSRDFIANTQYSAVNKIVARVEPQETVPETTAPTVPPTEPTTPSETTQPTQPEQTEPTVPDESSQPSEEPPALEPSESQEPSSSESQGQTD